MNERKRQLLERRATAWTAMQQLLDAAAAANRDLDATEIETYNRHEADIEAADTQLDVFVRHITQEQAFNETDRRARIGDILPGGGGAPMDEATEARMAAFRSFLRGDQYDRRALQADSDTEGGYLLAPSQTVVGLLKGVDNRVFMRQFATVHQLDRAESLGVVTLATDMGDADWTGEIITSTVDEALRLGRRELKPNYLTKETKLSRPLVRRTAGGAENLIMDRFAYLFGVTQEKGFMTGSGAGRPLGIFTASNDGISTGRDVSTDMASTDVTADGLIEVKHTLKDQYWANARWALHRDVVKRIRKLKDGNGQYLWLPGMGIGNGLTGGIASSILELPYFMSEYAPNTFTTGQYVAVLGDFSYYWIAEGLQMEMQILNELYARTNQFGYIARMEVDGMPVLEEAFVRAKLG